MANSIATLVEMNGQRVSMMNSAHGARLPCLAAWRPHLHDAQIRLVIPYGARLYARAMLLGLARQRLFFAS